jgi:hypothetical protein
MAEGRLAVTRRLQGGAVKATTQGQNPCTRDLDFADARWNSSQSVLRDWLDFMGGMNIKGWAQDTDRRQDAVDVLSMIPRPGTV